MMETIPQAICGIAVETEFLNREGYVVSGARDSASTTNRTSNKVGDVSVEHAAEGLMRVYEITVKEFGIQRINEAVQSLGMFFEKGIPTGMIVHVLCRPDDIPAEAERSLQNPVIAELEREGVLFQFIDLHAWLAVKIAEFDLNQRAHFFTEVQKFLNTGKNGRIPGTERQAWAAGFTG
ncbi:MAG: hypothetical protein QM597_00485 [Aeromicrobium sp.]|uniref:hypothetical protein n=1 Tax=Aeromicrobium sp. TaxID=1871063 RepID=UPI0039E30E98